MAGYTEHPINCPLCQQALTTSASERVNTPDGIMGWIPLSYVVERENLIADLQRQLAEQRFKTIDHEDP